VRFLISSVLARPLSDFNGLQYARNTASMFYRGA